MDDRQTETVRRFYTEAPFPNYGSRDTLGSLRLRAERSPLARLLGDPDASEEGEEGSG